ncbi:hypothetical protein [Natrinema halophilum]|uniref:Uncharacterized protein n=1 Tax=Natrinema halophilum TaxID=1699371 RepID=A0A7D5GFV1_9EURY|nr:hypothetical protein [Natrinema halophilum]QLG47894.1 hypothetical protein HYG82_03055 [Natrinema halophilum]
MTGGGAASLAFGKEQSFKGSLVDSDSDGTPEYWAFGRNPTVTELDLDRALERLTEGDQAESVESLATNLEGAFAVETVISSDVHGDVEDIVFNDAGTGFKAGRAVSSRVFAGIDYLDGTCERELIGCIPLEYSISYTQDGTLTYSLSMGYADEKTATSLTPSSVNQVSDGTSAAAHSFQLDVDGTTVTKLQEAELSITNISRFQRGPSPIAVDAVLARPETELTADAIFSGPSRLELAYGSSGSTSTQDRMSSVAGTITITIDGTALSTYNLAKLKPDTYSWNDLISDGDTDMTDSTTFNVDGGVTIS